MQANESILRPSILDSAAAAVTPAQPFANQQPQQLFTQEMNDAINSMVQQALEQQKSSLLSSLLGQNSETDYSSDQIIEERFINNLSEIDKIPDVVRCLREFSGEPSEFSSWKKSVERILQIYDSVRGTPKYFGILSVVRNKIVGSADIVLESYNTPLNWHAISKCLTLHYADKRDISTLEYQLMSLVQGNNSVEEFYKKVYSHLSLILNKISCMDINNNSIILLTKTYRDKALDTFVRGLNGDLPRLLAIREPIDLPQALHLCQKLENQNFRKWYAHDTANHLRHPQLSVARKSMPAITPQRYQPQQRNQYQQKPQLSRHQQQPGNHQEFHPQLAYLPQNTRYYYQQQQAPPRPSAPKPRLYEPMDIDVSEQSRRVNYMNRPNYNIHAGKRPGSSLGFGQKRQRNFHISNELQQPFEERKYEIEEPYISENQLPSEETLEQDYTDIHFLG